MMIDDQPMPNHDLVETKDLKELESRMVDAIGAGSAVALDIMQKRIGVRTVMNQLAITSEIYCCRCRHQYLDEEDGCLHCKKFGNHPVGRYGYCWQFERWSRHD